MTEEKLQTVQPISYDKITLITELNKQGLTYAKIARQLGITRGEVRYWVLKLGLVPRTRKPRFVIDGMKQCPKEELHSFIRHLCSLSNGKGFMVFIPKEIVRSLKLNRGDLVLAAIKKASAREIREYTTGGIKNES
jgi:hypothetical protein